MLSSAIATALELARVTIQDHSPTFADIYRLISPEDAESVSDGQGGMSTTEVYGEQRTLVASGIQCRIVVPKANREDSEYASDSSFISETRVDIVFPYYSDIRMEDKIVTTIGSVSYVFEVKVVAPHSNEISRHVSAVKISG